MYGAYFMGSRKIWLANNFKNLWLLVRKYERNYKFWGKNPEKVIFCRQVDINKLSKITNIIYETNGVVDKKATGWNICYF